MTNNKEINDDSIIYLGSHNLSYSAWGWYLKNDILKVNNVELGLILLPKKGSKSLKSQIISNLNF